MKVDLLSRTMVNSDLGVVNAARCSFDKESQWENCNNAKKLSQADTKLIHYLANNKHWTPFAHAQEVFNIHINNDELFNFLYTANVSGFEWPATQAEGRWKVRGSLYAWLTNAHLLPQDIKYNIVVQLLKQYPVSVKALWKQELITTLVSYEPSRVKRMLSTETPELQTFTLRIHCPIFVKRQLETHRRNFVMTDIEDFAQNEVSRRYIDAEPEMYEPKKWRLQAKDKKQGSSETVLQGVQEYTVGSNYRHILHTARIHYKKLNDLDIAHEQSRMLLPLSTYTTFWWTGSLKSWQRVFTLRLDSHAQSETREVVQMCYQCINEC